MSRRQKKQEVLRDSDYPNHHFSCLTHGNLRASKVRQETNGRFYCLECGKDTPMIPDDFRKPESYQE